MPGRAVPAPLPTPPNPALDMCVHAHPYKERFEMKHLIALFAAAGIASAAHADVLANWTFEVSVPADAGPHAAEGGIYGGNATGFHNDSAAVYSNPVGNGSFESFSSNTWQADDYYQFTTSTLGYQDITFQWSQTRSSTGPGDFRVQFSTDGVSFSDLLNYTIDNITWSSNSFNPNSVFGPIALPAAANNQATIYVRLTSNVAGSSTAGTNRVDDIFIEGTLIPAPGTFALVALSGLVAARRRRN